MNTLTISAAGMNEPAAAAVMWETQQEFHGGPIKPTLKKGWRHWWANRKALSEWRVAYGVWEAMGRPPRTMTYRYYIPRANVTTDTGQPITIPEEWTNVGYMTEST
jgi:hypothetical protein